MFASSFTIAFPGACVPGGVTSVAPHLGTLLTVYVVAVKGLPSAGEGEK
jgi:hypothetical protein